MYVCVRVSVFGMLGSSNLGTNPFGPVPDRPQLPCWIFVERFLVEQKLEARGGERKLAGPPRPNKSGAGCTVTLIG